MICREPYVPGGFAGAGSPPYVISSRQISLSARSFLTRRLVQDFVAYKRNHALWSLWCADSYGRSCAWRAALVNSEPCRPPCRATDTGNHTPRMWQSVRRLPRRCIAQLKKVLHILINCRRDW